MGRVTHFYGHVNAAIVLIEQGAIQVGDLLHFHGHTTDFTHRVLRIELEHAIVQRAVSGQIVGIEISERVREHDEVFKVLE